MLKEFSKKHFHSILLFLILAVAAFLRFYNTPDRYGFDPDAIRDAIITAHGASTFQFPLTGPISAIGPFPFGPFYYIQLILFKIIIPFDYSPWIYMSFISLLTIYLLYKIGELLKDKTFGLIIASLATVSPAQIAPAAGLSNPNLVTIQAVLAIWAFIIIIKKKPSSWWAFFLGISIGIGINNHYQMLAYFLLPFLFLFSHTKKRLSYFIFTLVGASVTLIPLYIFDLTHNHLITNSIIHTLQNGGINYVPNRWLFYLRDFWPSFWSYTLGVPVIIGVIIMILTISTNLFSVAKKILSRDYALLMVAFVVFFFLLRYYPGEREVYYLFFLHPFVFIFTGLVFYVLIISKKYILKYFGVTIFIFFFFFTFLNTFIGIHTFESHTIAESRVTKIIENYPNNKFIIYSCDGITDVDTQAVMFILNNKNKITDKGKKVGVLKKNCKNLDLVNKLSFIDTDMVSLSGLTDQELAKYGWVQISPDSIFNYYTKWYKK